MSGRTGVDMKNYDSTVARIAGNIACGLADRWVLRNGDYDAGILAMAKVSVRAAREIVAETMRTEPDPKVITGKQPT